MILWSCNFRTFEPFEHFLRVGTVAGERIFPHEHYHHEGKYRTSEKHCLFKYTLSGEGAFRDADGEHRVPAGSGFLCWIADPATAYYYPAGNTADWEFIYIIVRGGPAESMTKELVSRHGPIFNLPAGSGLIHRLLSLKTRGSGSRVIMPSESMEIATGLFNALVASVERQSSRPAENTITAAALKLIDDNLHRNMNVSELAEMMGISREHLSRSFSNEVKVTPHEYLRRRKIIFACRALKETPLPVKQIASRLGYDSPEHFSRTFKAVMHLSPRKFREVGVIPIN